jgi:mRNA-degrading endonuclease RelE of RelBE toxin-antitoxin system
LGVHYGGMEWHILKTELFDRKFEKLDKGVQQQIERTRDQLKQNPYVGKSLQLEFFREKKIGKFRVYYLVYKEYSVVYMITISEKKDQQRTINTIHLFLNQYRKEIEEWVQSHKD